MDIVVLLILEMLMIGAITLISLLLRKRTLAGITSGKNPVKSKSRENDPEYSKIKRMRSRHLNVPLSESARPSSLQDIIGQHDGIKGLKAAICGPNPQHVIIYGPPGIGKTCAARLVLEEAKRRPDSPFDMSSAFIELDATCVRFDERSIADPLIGSVHDPIYQGAGIMGTQGVPQPKPGAVTKAHCGVLFIDEIGELHPVQMNKLLKVLEDRCVHFDSAYYSPTNTAIPKYIHDIFQNGLPADFRLIGATTRSPEDIPPALRSRCVELFFKPLNHHELISIAYNAAQKLSLSIDDEALELCAEYSASGRDAVNIIQLAGSSVMDEKRKEITCDDIVWVAKLCHHARSISLKMPDSNKPGTCFGLAVSGLGSGSVIELQCSATRTAHNEGILSLGGIAEEEELELRGRKLKRKATSRVSAETVCRVFMSRFGLDCSDYNICFSIPGGIPMDGPSAGIALCVALMSAITQKPPVPHVAYTGEITVFGEVKPVGGVADKINAAIESGAKTVVIPSANMEERFHALPIEVIGVDDISTVMRIAFDIPKEQAWLDGVIPLTAYSA